MRLNRVWFVLLALLPLAYPVLAEFKSVSSDPVSSHAITIASKPITKIFDTSKRYQLRDGNYEEARRQEVHLPILRQWMVRGEPSAHPVVFLMLGPPGAGKSWLIPHLADNGMFGKEKIMEVDPDTIQNALPEYLEFHRLAPKEADPMVHEESGYLRDLIVESAMRQRMNVIRQGTMAHADEAVQLVKDLRRQGPEYQIKAVFVGASLPTLLVRVKQRSLKTGRLVPEGTVFRKFQRSRESLDAIRCLVDEVFIIDNEESPVLREHYRKGKLVFDSFPKLR